MLEAEERGDARRLSLLQGQWVHRFGVATLPVSTAAAPVSESPMAPLTPLSRESDVSVVAESSAAAGFLEIMGGTNEQQPVVAEQPAEPQRPVPAPPLSTPRSLRRWLPGAESSFPKAS